MPSNFRRLINVNRAITVYRHQGLLTIIDSFIDFSISIVREKLYRYKPREYGVLEAILLPKGLDYYLRYNDIVNALLKSAPLNPSILDVGAGGRGGISYFFSQNSSEIVLLDRKRFAKVPWSNYVLVGDGLTLPFKDKTFDIIVSVATLEHVPRKVRLELLAEFRRISKTIVLHFPCKDTIGRFKGDQCDLAFQNFHKKAFAKDEPKTAEHLQSGHPTVDEIKTALPDSVIIGRRNCNVWLRHISFSKMPIIGFLSGLLYLVVWKKKDNIPPFYECLVVYTET